VDEKGRLSMSQKHVARAVRTTRRQRAVGPDAHCTNCGSKDLAALVWRTRKGVRVLLCYERAQARDRKPTVEQHHPLGAANDPTTVGMPGNPHRNLSDQQLDWPDEVRHNEHRNPLWWIAGIFYALRDYLQWLERSCRQIGDILVKAGHWAGQQGGVGWWKDAGIQFP
jgi:hypothetical protein